MLRTTIQQAAERRQNLVQERGPRARIARGVLVASAASETLGYRSNQNRARFSGRQISLAIAVLTCLTLLGCSRSATNQPAPASQPPRPEVRSSADVVSFGGTGTAMTGSNNGEALVMMTIEPGYHVNANPATYPYLIATEVTADKVDGIEVGTAIYPPAKKQKFQFADEALAVYEGQVEVRLPIKVASKGSRSLPLNVRVQACDDEKCFPPATLKTNVSVEVK